MIVSALAPVVTTWLLGVLAGWRGDQDAQAARSLKGRLYEPGKRRPVSSEKAREMLRWMPRPVTATVLDTARSLQAANLV